ncbi:hypothetical protein [Saccharolobus islandicus]|uniref:Uncharacterized protein n=1 Tax=Saccharolobus islandicus (strain L.D.8.5 / Lassen \|nr:hypothetical protein [Sulfolobus islandicus]ADB87216.1 hypothetical protein LD85_1549 [Sulfolobus islandicus L.D.8.5]
MLTVKSLDEFLEENKVFKGRFRSCIESTCIKNNLETGECVEWICTREIVWKNDGTLELRYRKFRRRRLEVVEEIRPLLNLTIDNIYLQYIDKERYVKVNRFHYKTYMKGRFIIAEVEDNKYMIVDNIYPDEIKKKKCIEINIKKGRYITIKLRDREYMSEYPGVLAGTVLNLKHGYNPSYHFYIASLITDYTRCLEGKNPVIK